MDGKHEHGFSMNNKLPEYTRIMRKLGDVTIPKESLPSIAVFQFDEDPYTLGALVLNNSSGRSVLQLLKDELKSSQHSFHFDPDHVSFVEGKTIMDLHISNGTIDAFKSSSSDEFKAASQMQKLADRIINSAIRNNATDIHLQAYKAKIIVDFRIHGLLLRQRFDGVESPGDFIRSLVRRSDSASSSGDRPDNVSETFGFTHEAFNNAKYRLRCIKVPCTPDGSMRLSMRILEIDSTTDVRSFETLGYDKPLIDCVSRHVLAPHGLILIIGPVGSGKSTTLQTILSGLQKHYGGERLITSAEDPVEYQIPGVVQRDVSASSFADAITDALRMDMNIFMLGEIREEDVANQTIRVANTGHLTFSTMHAGDEITAIRQLVHLGVSPETLAEKNLLRMIVSQRLVPILCDQCSVDLDEAGLTEDRISHYKNTGLVNLSTVKFRGGGCENCNDMGVVGRTAIASVLVPDYRFLSMIEKRQWTKAKLYIRTLYQAGDDPVVGRLLQESAMAKVNDGLIDPRHLETIAGSFEEMLGQEEAKQQLKAIDG